MRCLQCNQIDEPYLADDGTMRCRWCNAPSDSAPPAETVAEQPQPDPVEVKPAARKKRAEK